MGEQSESLRDLLHLVRAAEACLAMIKSTQSEYQQGGGHESLAALREAPVLCFLDDVLVVVVIHHILGIRDWTNESSVCF